MELGLSNDDLNNSLDQLGDRISVDKEIIFDDFNDLHDTILGQLNISHDSGGLMMESINARDDMNTNIKI